MLSHVERGALMSELVTFSDLGTFVVFTLFLFLSLLIKNRYKILN